VTRNNNTTGKQACEVRRPYIHKIAARVKRSGKVSYKIIPEKLRTQYVQAVQDTGLSENEFNRTALRFFIDWVEKTRAAA